MDSKIPFKNSFVDFNFEGQDIKNPMQNTLMTLNEIGKTVVNIDILDNTNQILKNKELQRKMEQKKFIDEQERKLKSQLQKQRNQQLIIEDENMSKLVNEAFQIDVSSLYQSNNIKLYLVLIKVAPMFPILDESKMNENNWKKISKSIITPISPMHSYFSELQNGQNEDKERYKLMHLRSNFSSKSYSRSEKSFEQNINTILDKKQDKNKNIKKQNDKIMHTEQENQEFLLYTLSSDFVQSAIKNKDKNQKKFRRINIKSLEKEVKFNIFENENQDYQFISKERYNPKIFLDKKIVIVENVESKYPSYHPPLQSAQQKYRRNFNQNSQENIQKSLSMHSTIQRKQQEANQDFKSFQKFMSFKSECVLDKQRKRNDILLETMFDNIFNKYSKEQNSSKMLKSHMKSPRSRIFDKNESNQPIGNIINRITRDLRRKSCYCSECGDLTTKQKENYLIILDNEKKIARKNSKYLTSPRRKDFFDTEQKNLNSSQTSLIPSYSNFYSVQKQKNSSSRRSSLFHLNLKSVHESQKDDDNQQHFDRTNQYKIQIQPNQQQSQNELGQTFQNIQIRQQTENLDTDQVFSPRNSTKSLHMQPNKVFQMKLEHQKKIQTTNMPNHQQKKQRYVYPSPNDIKLKQLLHGQENNNYIIDKAQNDCDNQYRRLKEHIKRNIISQCQRQNKDNNYILNDSNRTEFLKKANKMFMENCQKSVYLKKLRNDRSNPKISKSQFQQEQTESNQEQSKHSTKQQIMNQYGLKNKQFSITRRKSDFIHKAYSSHSTFQSTRGFIREKKYLSIYQDQTEQQIRDIK